MSTEEAHARAREIQSNIVRKVSEGAVKRQAKKAEKAKKKAEKKKTK